MHTLAATVRDSGEGERRWFCGGGQMTGGIAVLPRGVPHAFLVNSARARMLCLQTPGSGEAFFRHASEPAPEGSQPVPVDFERIHAAASETGAIEILGPPPF